MLAGHYEKLVNDILHRNKHVKKKKIIFYSLRLFFVFQIGSIRAET